MLGPPPIASSNGATAPCHVYRHVSSRRHKEAYLEPSVYKNLYTLVPALHFLFIYHEIFEASASISLSRSYRTTTLPAAYLSTVNDNHPRRINMKPTLATIATATYGLIAESPTSTAVIQDQDNRNMSSQNRFGCTGNDCGWPNVASGVKAYTALTLLTVLIIMQALFVVASPMVETASK